MQKFVLFAFLCLFSFASATLFVDAVNDTITSLEAFNILSTDVSSNSTHVTFLVVHQGNANIGTKYNIFINSVSGGSTSNPWGRAIFSPASAPGDLFIGGWRDNTPGFQVYLSNGTQVLQSSPDVAASSWSITFPLSLIPGFPGIAGFDFDVCFTGGTGGDGCFDSLQNPQPSGVSYNTPYNVTYLTYIFPVPTTVPATTTVAPTSGATTAAPATTPAGTGAPATTPAGTGAPATTPAGTGAPATTPAGTGAPGTTNPPSTDTLPPPPPTVVVVPPALQGVVVLAGVPPSGKRNSVANFTAAFITDMVAFFSSYPLGITPADISVDSVTPTGPNSFSVNFTVILRNAPLQVLAAAGEFLGNKTALFELIQQSGGVLGGATVTDIAVVVVPPVFGTAAPTTAAPATSAAPTSPATGAVTTNAPVKSAGILLSLSSALLAVVLALFI